MSSEFGIRIKDLHKEFVVNHTGIASLKSLLVFWKKRTVVRKEVLKGVSLEVKRGECLAIIGKNGAGKSTLLSLLARIYKPTSGTIEVNGRVAPLLELGAGFGNEPHTGGDRQCKKTLTGFTPIDRARSRFSENENRHDGQNQSTEPS